MTRPKGCMTVTYLERHRMRDGAIASQTYRGSLMAANMKSVQCSCGMKVVTCAESVSGLDGSPKSCGAGLARC